MDVRQHDNEAVQAQNARGKMSAQKDRCSQTQQHKEMRQREQNRELQESSRHGSSPRGSDKVIPTIDFLRRFSTDILVILVRFLGLRGRKRTRMSSVLGTLIITA